MRTAMVRIGSARSDYSQGEAMAALSGFDDAIQLGVKPRILSGTSRAADYFPKIISNVSARAARLNHLLRGRDDPDRSWPE